MDEAEVKKTCRSCGKDLRHQRRCKSRDGTYLCPECSEDKHRWDRQLIAKLADKKYQWFVLYAILAVLACVVFWKLLDIIAHAD
jgi:hypothetical protein